MQAWGGAVATSWLHPAPSAGLSLDDSVADIEQFTLKLLDAARSSIPFHKWKKCRTRVPWFIKECRQALRERAIPPSWRETSVVPIPKPGKDPSDPSNYGPIALTSCLSEGKHLQHLERTIQLCINNVQKYVSENDFRFSLSKTICVHFHRQRIYPEPTLHLNGQPIPVTAMLSKGRSLIATTISKCYVDSYSEVSNRELYPTFARTKPTDSQISGSVVSILKRFNWKRVTFIHQLNEEYNITADTIIKLMQEHDIEVTSLHTYTGPYFHAHQLNPFVKIVSETRHNTRIYVMLGDPHEFVGLMEHLQDLGLLDTGAYFVVGVTRDTYNLDKPQEFLQGQNRHTAFTVISHSFVSKVGAEGKNYPH
ncbi:guanylate cyclase [Plakobranchus ocellatus]|uniref:Guanylate cyclase n=1 Tax=Plakobranchus ocellatus TaxID=259542 RepID=A0AAV4C240_9GAST|nr:guanylate cyclase [Plakobranchus ocellatus]